MSLEEWDGCGWDVLQVTNDSNARSVSEWIILNTAGNEIAVFVSSHFCCQCALREKKVLLLCIKRIQAWQQRNKMRKTYHVQLLSRLDEMHQFQDILGGCLVGSCQLTHFS
jgi:hypothetical protein